ncbi:MAG: heme exporter protein CcmD [Gammaproteobacteria bacterium]|nr:heme exporter protein CcmD [Gammaproteobacteria bacterium]MDP2140869.1 heme exporter protein CcmD [Gammaproteobacteria bacterium]MDP2349387.1 heme exporter protein CcmD [Gammaproteobacteria bacterium]
MGRYGFHVWSVYALFTIFIIANLLVPHLQRKQFIREQKSRALRDGQINGTASSSSAAPGESV